MRGFSLVALRTIVSCHFADAGYFLFIIAHWEQGGAGRAWRIHAIDLLVPIGLLLVGLSLMLGLFTQTACAGAIAFLALFYLSQPPLAGIPQPNAEGSYLLVNKNLIELGAVFVVLAFRTGAIAGLDRLWTRPSASLAVAV